MEMPPTMNMPLKSLHHPVHFSPLRLDHPELSDLAVHTSEKPPDLASLL